MVVELLCGVAVADDPICVHCGHPESDHDRLLQVCDVCRCGMFKSEADEAEERLTSGDPEPLDFDHYGEDDAA